jgi:hypothetical protein
MSKKAKSSTSHVTLIGMVEHVKHSRKKVRFMVRDGDSVYAGDCLRENLVSGRSGGNGADGWLTVGDLVIVTGKLLTDFNHYEQRHHGLIRAALVSTVSNHAYLTALVGSRRQNE